MTAGVCPRCGDFICPRCATYRPGICDTCVERATPNPSTFGTRFALGVAIVCSALSGLELIGLLALVASFNKADPASTWNGVVGVIYLFIAVGLWRRSPKAYSWAITTHGLNAALNTFYLLDHKGGGPGAGIYYVIMGSRFALAGVGFLSTRLSKPEFMPRFPFPVVRRGPARPPGAGARPGTAPAPGAAPSARPVAPPPPSAGGAAPPSSPPPTV
jgi:hypothetical protein